jgi:hypothetical protein
MMTTITTMMLLCFGVSLNSNLPVASSPPRFFSSSLLLLHCSLRIVSTIVSTTGRRMLRRGEDEFISN